MIPKKNPHQSPLEHAKEPNHYSDNCFLKSYLVCTGPGGIIDEGKFFTEDLHM